MKICDAHLHYGRRKPIEQMISTSPMAERFPCYRMVQLDAMDCYAKHFSDHNVECTVLVPFVFREVSIPEENNIVLEYARKDPEHRYPYALLDEENPTFIEKHFQEYVGVKEHIVLNESVLTPEKRIIFESLRDHSMTFLIHSQLFRRVEYLEGILKEFPGIKIQIAHMGRGRPGDTETIFRMLEVFRSYETVTFDTSTTREPWIIERAVNLVGAERILYGSDLPFYMENSQEDIMEAQMRQILLADITDDQREAIFFRNFTNWIQRGV